MNMADRFQALCAACPRRRPRVASALTAQATPRLGAALTPPASARVALRFISIFCSVFLAAATAELGPHLRRRHSRHQLVLAAPSPPQ